MAPNKKLHFVLICYPAYGHLIPMIELARKISKHHTTTFATSNAIIQHLLAKQEISADDRKHIKVSGIEDGISDLSDNTVQPLIWEDFQRKYFPSVEKYISTLQSVDVVIGDLFYAEALTECTKKEIPYCLFHSGAFAAFQSFANITEGTPVGETEPFTIVKPEAEGTQNPVGKVIKSLSISMNTHLTTAAGLVINTCEDLERDLLFNFAEDPRIKHTGMRFYCVGPLIPEKKNAGTNHVLEEKVKIWLDKKPEKSVVYISFGTVAFPDETWIEEIGKALLKLKKPFVFALKEKIHGLLPKEIKEGIAKQFEGDSTLGLVLPWAPQKLILSHPGAGVFVSHCGWNSAIESIFAGVPVVGWPIFGDQLDDALLLEKLGMGVSLVRMEDTKHLIKAEEIVCGIENMTSTGSAYHNAAKWKELLLQAVETGSTCVDLGRLNNFFEM